MKLLTFSNYIPEQIGDVSRFIRYNGSFRQSHYCQYVQDFLSNVMEDQSIDGAVLPNSCDSARSSVDYLSGKYLYQLKHPVNNDDNAVQYFAEIIRHYKESLELYFGQTITTDSIMERTDALRKRGQYLYDRYQNISDISYSAYINQINTMLLNPLAEWRKYASTPPPLHLHHIQIKISTLSVHFLETPLY